MKIFTYGISKRQMSAIRWTFKNAEYIDVSDAYQDILALCADVVIMSTDNASDDVLATIKSYQEEVGEDDSTEYYYVSDEELIEWEKELYTALENSLDDLVDRISPKEFEVMYLFCLQQFHDSIITNVFIDDDVKFYEYYRPSIGKRELLILSLGDDLINAAKYHFYKEKYDIVSVACYKEEMSRRGCVREIFEERVIKGNLPPDLWQMHEKLTKASEPFMYAYFGE